MGCKQTIQISSHHRDQSSQNKKESGTSAIAFLFGYSQKQTDKKSKRKQGQNAPQRKPKPKTNQPIEQNYFYMQPPTQPSPSLETQNIEKKDYLMHEENDNSNEDKWKSKYPIQCLDLSKTQIISSQEGEYQGVRVQLRSGILSTIYEQTNQQTTTQQSKKQIKGDINPIIHFSECQVAKEQNVKSFRKKISLLNK